MADDCCGPNGSPVATSADAAPSAGATSGTVDAASVDTGPAGVAPVGTAGHADVPGCGDGCCSAEVAPQSGSGAGPGDHRRAVLSRRVRLFVAATITYNVIEAVVAITAGAVASSAALIGFGLDSTVEVASAAAVAWQFAGRDPERRERLALKVIAVSFFALAAYVTFESVTTLAGGEQADHSTVGIALAAVSLVVMPFLSYAQRRAGRELGSASAVADSKQTLLCTYLSGVVLAGLLLNSLLGWAWADPAAALVIAALAVKEGRDAWRGDHCC
ncbi:Cation efflux family protein [Prauserella alba]|uniref:Cation efflux protein transmembrane domain-containing protein n=1 Tax=Prauserella alba TaxID=176898 RepID=A0ABN1V5H1_9PSEU|nr:Cation efflux family protein [Prauserella alba]